MELRLIHFCLTQVTLTVFKTVVQQKSYFSLTKIISLKLAMAQPWSYMYEWQMCNPQCKSLFKSKTTRTAF